MVDTFNNKIPNFLNIAMVIFIFVALLGGTTQFLLNYDQATGIHNYEVFVPSGVAVGLYASVLFVVNLFANADLATVMLLLLLFFGIVIILIGFFFKDEIEKSTFFHLGSAAIGLALGIPFGEKLRQTPKPSNPRKPRTKKAAANANSATTTTP